MYQTLLKTATPIGSLGVVLLLVAYFAVSTGRLSANQIWYQAANFIAAWLILYSLFFHWNTPSVMIEIAWITISLVGMYRIWQKNLKK